MAYQIDVLSTPANLGAKFVVDTTGPVSVDLQQCVPGNPQIMTAGSGTIGGGGYLFADGDCMTILSAGYMIPFGFNMAQYETGAGGEYTMPVMYLRGQVPAGPILSVNQFGNNGNLRFPFNDYELSLGTFFDPVKRGITGGAFRLETLFPLLAGGDNPQVSMINAPAALNGETIYVTPFIKVLHNFPLT